MKVYLSPVADYKLTELLVWLEEEWGQAAKTKFLKKLEHKFTRISNHPESNPRTEDFEELRWCVVTPQSSFYYRVLEKEEEIEIVTITDNRQHPERIIKELRKHFNTN